MERSTKSSWLEGPTDLREETIEDVPVKGQSVLVRGLAAKFSNDAQGGAVKLITSPTGAPQATLDVAEMEILQFHHGVVEPSFTVEEVRQIAERFGPAFKRVVERIDDLSGVDKEAIENAEDRFPPVRNGAAGDDVPGAVGPADSGPDVRPRAGARTRNARG